MSTSSRSVERRKVKQDCLRYLKQESCIVCGFDILEGLTFHHLNPKTKKFNISKNLHLDFNVLKRELKKTVVLCKNCHCAFHAGVLYLEDYITN